MTNENSNTDLSQDAIALAFAAQHAGKFKYVATNVRVRWFIFNDATQKFELDDTQYVRDCIRALCRSLAPEDDPALARAMCSHQFVWEVEQLAGIDRRFAATKAELGIGPKPKVAMGKRKPKAEAEAEAVQP